MPGEIYIRDVAFTLPNATGNFTITDTGGPGLTPKAAMIVLSGASALDTITSHARLSVGITDGTNHRATAWMAEDDVLASVGDTGKRLANDKVLNLTGTAAEGLQVGATFVSFAANAITINVDAASVLRGFVRLFYGADLLANVTSIVGAASTDTSTTAPGFTPDGAIFIGSRTTNDYGVDTGLANAHVTIGAAGRLPSTSQGCISLVAEDRPASGNSSSACKPRDNRVATMLASSSGTITETASLSLKSWDASGLTVTNDAATAMTVAVLSLKLNGEKCHAGCPTLNTDTLGVSSYTDPGFTPRALMLAAQVAPTINTADSTAGGGFSLGVVTMGTGSYCAGWNDNDDKSTTEADCLVSSSKMIDFPESAVSRFWAAELSSMTASGFDYNVTNAHSVDLPTLVFAIGEQPGSLGWLDARSGHRWRRRLARM